MEQRRKENREVRGERKQYKLGIRKGEKEKNENGKKVKNEMAGRRKLEEPKKERRDGSGKRENGRNEERGEEIGKKNKDKKYRSYSHQHSLPSHLASIQTGFLMRNNNSKIYPSRPSAFSLPTVISFSLSIAASFLPIHISFLSPLTSLLSLH